MAKNKFKVGELVVGKHSKGLSKTIVWKVYSCFCIRQGKSSRYEYRLREYGVCPINPEPFEKFIPTTPNAIIGWVGENEISHVSKKMLNFIALCMVAGE